MRHEPQALRCKDEQKRETRNLRQAYAKHRFIGRHAETSVVSRVLVGIALPGFFNRPSDSVLIHDAAWSCVGSQVNFRYIRALGHQHEPLMPANFRWNDLEDSEPYRGCSRAHPCSVESGRPAMSFRFRRCSAHLAAFFAAVWIPGTALSHSLWRPIAKFGCAKRPSDLRASAISQISR